MNTKPKPSVEDLMERVELLSRKMEQMIDEVREDVAALRDDVRGIAPRTSQSIPKQHAVNEPGTAARRKRDPRIDED